MLTIHSLIFGITLFTKPSFGITAYTPGLTTALVDNKSLGYPIFISPLKSLYLSH